ncbi:hypothetical protein DQM68_13170 [Leptospira mayottensis]|uniref:Uncharacterized protein n=2 Tax=Leptospira mayottensis TaxID=1137606 RepID=A0AA87MP57_9LEPT|nr:hypothetical protein DQM68_13170 [Leptospira mayottensis]AXR65249.1 hypothetical protein DQM28_14520 [Leptospira mayottensis]AZQ02072.1 hypothetical protein LEP1GSC190_08540 [Leptospira mayottensis 200901116]EKS01120.1 hypothetical protein LEP1GSC125_3821 [Leptospira mayottensis 200901122]TGN13920.1 hypothetical protein EHR03_04550 [Leptospira mayottensis]
MFGTIRFLKDSNFSILKIRLKKLIERKQYKRISKSRFVFSIFLNWEFEFLSNLFYILISLPFKDKKFSNLI